MPLGIGFHVGSDLQKVTALLISKNHLFHPAEIDDWHHAVLLCIDWKAMTKHDFQKVSIFS